MPQVFSGSGVECGKIAVGISGENQSASGREASSIGRRKIPELPLLLASERVEGAERSPGFFPRHSHIDTSEEVMPLVVFLRRIGENIALLRDGNVEQLGLRTVRGGKPVGRTQGSWTGARPLGRRLAAGQDNRPAVRANLLSPGEPWEERLGGKKLAIGTVQHRESRCDSRAGVVCAFALAKERLTERESGWRRSRADREE